MLRRSPRSPVSQAASSGVQNGVHRSMVLLPAVLLMQYAVRSAPSVVLPELTTAFGRTTLGVSSVLGPYDYTYCNVHHRRRRVARSLGTEVHQPGRGGRAPPYLLGFLLASAPGPR